MKPVLPRCIEKVRPNNREIVITAKIIILPLKNIYACLKIISGKISGDFLYTTEFRNI